MADINSNSSRKVAITGPVGSRYILGDASSAVVGTFGIQVVNDGAFVGTITVKARSRSPEAQAANAPWNATVYEKLYLNGAVGDGTLVSTGITTDSNILVPASGFEIALEVTAYTSGSCTAYVVPLEGAAA